MYVRYGGYLHALDEVGFSIDKRPISQGGIQVGVEETWSLTGFLQAASQAALVTAMTTLEIAYGRNQQTAQILLNNGTTVARQMPGVHVLGGTEVIEGVSYPNDGMGANGAEFVDYRTFTVKIRGRYAVELPPSYQLIQFNETIQFSGGGPQDVHIESQIGPPQKQRLKQFTTYRAVQSGSAVGLLTLPVPPAPLWPSALETAPQIVPGSPKRSGGSGAPILTEWPISWTYVFADSQPLRGLPNYWR